MEIWLDTFNKQAVQKAVQFGLLSGVTTNPSIIAASGRCLEDVLEDLLHHQEGPVTAQVVAEETDEMVQQGHHLFAFSNRVVVKIPVTEKGLKAIHLLSRKGIPTMATALFTVNQALMAALAGADYVAPYLGRLEKAGENPWAILNAMTTIFSRYQLKTKILGASIHHVEQAMKCAEAGIFGITVKDELFDKLIGDHDMTIQSVQLFAADWKKANSSLLTV